MCLFCSSSFLLNEVIFFFLEKENAAKTVTPTFPLKPLWDAQPPAVVLPLASCDALVPRRRYGYSTWAVSGPAVGTPRRRCRHGELEPRGCRFTTPF